MIAKPASKVLRIPADSSVSADRAARQPGAASATRPGVTLRARGLLYRAFRQLVPCQSAGWPGEWAQRVGATLRAVVSAHQAVPARPCAKAVPARPASSSAGRPARRGAAAQLPALPDAARRYPGRAATQVRPPSAVLHGRTCPAQPWADLRLKPPLLLSSARRPVRMPANMTAAGCCAVCACCDAQPRSAARCLATTCRSSSRTATCCATAASAC
jgi:hypothetical protein